MKMKMEEMTGGEARALYVENPVVLVPLGSYEDQGPHAPMGDFLLCERMAEKIAQAATELGVRTVVAPVLPFGATDFFGSMPGGIAVSQATFGTILSEVLSSLLRHGLNRIVVINGHGGNSPGIQSVTQELYRTKAVLVPCIYLWQAGHRLLPSIVGEEQAKKRSGHGADPLTSIALHLFPDLVRHDMVPEPSPIPNVIGLPVSGFGTVAFEGVDVYVPVESDEIAPNGVFGGDPRQSSDETGRILVDRLTNLGSAFVAHFAKNGSGLGDRRPS